MNIDGNEHVKMKDKRITRKRIRICLKASKFKILNFAAFYPILYSISGFTHDLRANDSRPLPLQDIQRIGVFAASAALAP